LTGLLSISNFKRKVMDLYPLKFHSILKERIWGGNKLETQFGKDLGGKTNIGESWELSAVEDSISVVSNGPLAGNDLQELIEIYMGDLVGEKVFEKFGTEFPLLIKLIDAEDDLSIQVHPDDKMAAKRHNAFGKTEMWIALDDEDNPRVITGFNQNTDKETFLKMLNNNTVTQLFNFEQVKKGDVFFVPAGRVHTICAGNVIAEIQQTSDITYRIYDYDRKDEKGFNRDLHLDLALDVIDYSKVKNPKTKYIPLENTPVELVSCEYFTTNQLNITKPIGRDYYSLDSFVVYLCIEGSCEVRNTGGYKEIIKKGDTILIPSSLNSIELKPISEKVELLEVYIK
jgi:mannose-6-phosphate isomerase